ncbi:hypothetical protein [Pleionea mediterranea]|uniref:DUF1579 domain-containing protein n=1 Tax=Pleionea mediterranea TaxID=523701 RepID=A0A316G025_9GAMM|nr:hypothetical protein [Pleionea mediterranea]PWK54002.1 hypothetical protein C8D97_102394 [Pleionea mediterranea]
MQTINVLVKLAAVLSVVVCLGVFSAEPPKACQSVEHRQFDFWIGDWNVYSKDGKLVGTNSITSSLNGCVLKEHYKTAKGYEGESFNLYDATTKQWHQTWVDNAGTLLQLDGVWNGQVMTLLGKGLTRKGEPVTHRIQWRPQDNGDVHQVWDITKDGGQHWQSNFFGVYQKKQRQKKK